MTPLQLRLFTLGLEIGGLLIWLIVTYLSKWGIVEPIDRQLFRIADGVILMFLLVLFAGTFVALLQAQPVRATSFTPLVAAVLGCLSGGGVALKFSVDRKIALHPKAPGKPVLKLVRSDERHAA